MLEKSVVNIFQLMAIRSGAMCSFGNTDYLGLVYEAVYVVISFTWTSQMHVIVLLS